MSIHTKIYLPSFVDYQYLKKYFYMWNIPLNYCFICKIISRLTLCGNASGYSSNAYNLTPLFHPLWKTVHNSVAMIMSFKVLKYFSNGKISFFLFASLLEWYLKLEKLMFFFKKSCPTILLILFQVFSLHCVINILRNEKISGRIDESITPFITKSIESYNLTGRICFS